MKKSQLRSIIKETIKAVLSEEEFVDASTGEVAPGPRDRIPGEEDSGNKEVDDAMAVAKKVWPHDDITKVEPAGKVSNGTSQAFRVETGQSTYYKWLLRNDKNGQWSSRGPGRQNRWAVVTEKALGEPNITRDKEYVTDPVMSAVNLEGVVDSEKDGRLEKIKSWAEKSLRNVKNVELDVAMSEKRGGEYYRIDTSVRSYYIIYNPIKGTWAQLGLSEMSTTGGVAAYQTPFAFSKRGYSKKGYEGSKALGYTLAKKPYEE